MKICKTSTVIFLACWSFLVVAQYPPPAGQPGTTAMHRDSSAFVRWAQTCEVSRGYINITDTTVYFEGTNKANYGSYLYATGPADDYVVSLGDRGWAVLTFDPPLADGPGPDFAVFENSFSSSFLELAFVEVSSDGNRYVRFPAVSLTQADTQVGTFDTLDAKQIHNFAGKYRMGFGTPFDLDDLKDSSGVQLDRITHMRVIDVGGCLQPGYASFDSEGHAINDPWPTPFGTGGFDLDAIGVIHDTLELSTSKINQTSLKIYPNPVSDFLRVDIQPLETGKVVIRDLSGRVLLHESINGIIVTNLATWASGVYLVTVSIPDGRSVTRKIIR